MYIYIFYRFFSCILCSLHARHNKLYSICVFKMSLEVFVPGTNDFDDPGVCYMARSNPWFATQIIVNCEQLQELLS